MVTPVKKERALTGGLFLFSFLRLSCLGTNKVWLTYPFSIDDEIVNGAEDSEEEEDEDA
jgi:hypothetical protein